MKDIKGQLLQVTDPLGRVIFEHAYDTAGNNLWTEHRDSGVRTAVVDALGRPMYTEDAKGARIYTSYDSLGRPTGVWARDNGTEFFTRRQWLIYGDQAGLDSDAIARNLMGQLYLHYDEAGKVQVEAYDFKGNPLEKTRWVIADAQTVPLFNHLVEWELLDESVLDTKAYTTTLAYDGLSRVRAALYPEDVASHRTEVLPEYNRAGALQSLWQDGVPYIWQIAYNAKGQRLLLTMANGMMTRYTYDPLNFRLLHIRSEKFDLTSVSHPLIPDGGVQQDLAYQYDLGGNIIGIRDKAPASGSVQGPGDLLKEFSYDPLKRLLAATGRESTAPSALPTWDAGLRAHDHTATNTYTRAYSYDKVGNVLQEQHTADGHGANSFTKEFNYHATGDHNRLLSYEVGATTFALEYDANGNLLKETTSRYHQWDHSDQLKYFMVRAGSSGPPSVWAHYFYDAAGTRLKKVVSKLVGGNLIQEVTVYIDGVFEETYVTNNGTVDPDRHYNTLHVMDGRSRIATIRVGTDVEDPTPTVKFNLEDHLGTSSVTVASNAMLINREEYYPFGDTCFGAFAKKRYRYVGKEKDNETGLYYYGARYYAAWTCRFVSVDPLADKYMYLTPYNYAANDPIGDFDIDGQQNNKSAQDGGGDQMNFSDMLPKGNDTDSSKPPVVLQMEKKANGGFATGKELEAPDTVGGVNGLIDHAVKKLDQGIGAVKDVADRAKKATFKAAATATVDKLDAMSNGEWSAPASDDDVNAYQLAYQWVHGTGPVERTFNENSTMGQGMLRTEYVEKAMFLSAKNAFDGKFRSQQARRSLGKLSLIGSSLYAFDFFRDVTVGNEVRGFQGSIGGSVQAGGPINLLDNFTIQVPLTIQLTDSMSARSGSRASGQAGGYDIENPTAVYKENNPYGPNGPFRTITVNYDMQVNYKLHLPYPAYIKNPAYFAP